jgi:hypothetical protein
MPIYRGNSIKISLGLTINKGTWWCVWIQKNNKSDHEKKS